MASNYVPLPPIIGAVDINTSPINPAYVEVTNGPGAAAVNIQDGGNSITVDGSVGRTWTLSSGTDSVSATVVVPGTVSVTQGTSPWVVSGTIAATQSGVWTVGRTWALTSGTDSIAVTQSTSPWIVSGGVASGSADSGDPVKIGGVYNSTPIVLTTGQRGDVQLDTAGAVYVNPEGRKQTFTINSSATIAANPTDVFTLTGSSTKTIRVREATVWATNTGNTNVAINFIKRSTADSGGTSTTPTAVALDSTNSAGTAVGRIYTANPTLGTAIGSVGMGYLVAPALASTNNIFPFQFNFGDQGTQPLVLRGTSEQLVVNLGGTAIGGTTVLTVHIDWTEE